MSVWSDLARYKKGGFPIGYTTVARTFYSPIDDVHGALMHLLNAASKLRISMFAYSDPSIDAVLKAKSGGDFLMTLDDKFTGGPTEISLLMAWDQSLFGTKIAVGTSSRYRAISHLKLASLDDAYTITGSTNWTVSGQRSQDNQLTVIRNKPHAIEAAQRIEAVHAFMLAEMTAKHLWPPAAPTALAAIEF